MTCLSFADIYALVGPESTGFANWSQAAGIATALGSTHGLPGRGPVDLRPGRGVRHVRQLRRARPRRRGRGAQHPEEQITTRPDYTASANDNAIIEGIAGSPTSLGWVGFAFYEENLDTVKAIQVAEEPNGTCVEPTAETIADNSYPISRDLYIYVNKAKAAENPAVAAYVDYYLADGTISTVLETVPYVNLCPPRPSAETQAAWAAR